MTEDINKIKAVIKAMGLKKSHVAQQAGISRVLLSYVINGKRPLTEKTKAKLFDYLGLQSK